MAETYQIEYGAPGDVLYPSRAKDSGIKTPPATYSRRDGPLVAAYAGSINSTDYARLIAVFAEALARRGGRLLLFGPHSASELARLGLQLPNVEPQGLVSSQMLIERLRREADVLFVPMSFETTGNVHQNMMFSFPSKLTDYTVTGVPLVISGPEQCSAVRWAREYPGVAEVVADQQGNGLDAALSRLEDADYRQKVGSTASLVGERLFSHAAAVDLFFKRLTLPGASITQTLEPRRRPPIPLRSSRWGSLP